MKLLRRTVTSARTAVNLVALVVIIVSVALLGVFLFFEEWGEKYTSGRIPTQFYEQLARENLLDDYARVFGVAHNSGGALDTTREAVAHGADVIEIDVVSLDGTLYSAHIPPLPIIGQRLFRGPPLAAVWDTAREADALKLDLKDSSPRLLDLLFAFLAERQEHEVLVTTGDEQALAAFKQRLPRVVRLLSVGNRQQLRELRTRPERIALIDGVSIQHQVLDTETAVWLQAQGLLVLAWTVNDLERVNELVRLGVDAITTDNLAIMELLGGQQRHEAWLHQRFQR